MLLHISASLRVWSLISHKHQGIYVMFSAATKCISDTRVGVYLADKLPLSAHEGDAVLHRQVQSSLYGLLQREIKVKPTQREKKVSHNILALPSLLRVSRLFVSPLVEFWVEVSLLGGSSPLGGSLLVRQQDEGNIRVCTIFGAGCQGSVGRTQTQRVLVPSAPGRTFDCKELKSHRDLQECTVMKSLLSSTE